MLGVSLHIVFRLMLKEVFVTGLVIAHVEYIIIYYVILSSTIDQPVIATFYVQYSTTVRTL